jgi:GNAT superfamily N-acetyltransferase
MTIEGPKAAKGMEIRSARELSHRIFSREGAPLPAERLPTPSPDEVWENLRVFTDDGRAISAVSMTYREVVLLGTRHLACCFGGVCTDPDYRGQGLASRLLEDCKAKAIADGADLVLISGRRGLYRRQGYEEVGDFNVCTIDRSRLPTRHATGAGDALRAPQPGDLPALMKMHLAEPARFVRTPGEFLRLVTNTVILNARGQTLVVCDTAGGEPLGYVACQIGGPPWTNKDPRAITVVEFAGSRWAIAHALAELLDRHGVASLELHCMGCDAELAEIARSWGWPSEPRAFRGTVAVISPECFWRTLSPLLRERLGPQRFDGLALSGDGPVRIACGDESLCLPDMTAFTRLAFTHRRRRHELELGLPADSRLGEMLEELFPLPLVNYGLNYF